MYSEFLPSLWLPHFITHIEIKYFNDDNLNGIEDFMNIHESYVNLEIAKLLKEAGFDWEVYTYYTHIIIKDLNMDETTGLMFGGKCNYNSSDDYSAPSLSIAQRWLREVKDIYITVYKDFTTIDGWHYFVVKKEDWESGNESNFYQQESNNHTYEQAQEAGIKKALEILGEETVKLALKPLGI